MLASAAAARRDARASRAGSRRASRQFDLGGDTRGPRVERLDLLAIERDLLFLACDGDLASVRGLTRLGRPCLRLDQLDAQAAEVGLDLADAPRRRPPRARARR
jgi:hypothetical protein